MLWGRSPCRFYTNPRIAYTNGLSVRQLPSYLRGMDMQRWLWGFLDPRRWWLRHLLFWGQRYFDSIIDFFGLENGREKISWHRFVTEFMLPDLLLVYFNLLVLVPFLELWGLFWSGWNWTNLGHLFGLFCGVAAVLMLPARITMRSRSRAAAPGFF